MKNIWEWKPSKIIKSGEHYKPNLRAINVQSYYFCSATLDLYVKYIRDYAQGRLLDCGCGLVPYYEVYKDQVDEIICTDWENSLHGNKLVDVYSDLNDKLNFIDLSFDTVLLTDVLEHIYHPAKLLSEIQRVLKPGGKVIIAVPFLYRIHEQPHDYFRYTEYSLVKLCHEAGLKIIKLEAYGEYLDVLFDTINKVFIRSRFCLKTFMPFTRLIKRSFINRKINRAFQNTYPLGYILCAEKI